MIEVSLGEIARVVGGRLSMATGDELVTGSVEFDSRKVTEGGLFVALPGERVDGHDFAAAAAAAGASGVLAARPVNAPAVVVPPATDAAEGVYALAADTDGSGAAILEAFGRLAAHVVDTLAERGLTVVGVTGSSGKTSTKDLIAQLLGPMGETVAPPGSFNNEIGLPWTALRADAATEHLVLEFSARGAGHIAKLCRTARPRIGVVLNVGRSHIEEFGSQDGVARAKGELVEALPADGLAILNADDPRVAAMAGRTEAEVLLFGRDPLADVRAVDVVTDGQARASFTLRAPDGDAPVRLRLHGEHQVGNALAAAAVALRLGASVSDVAERLSAAGRVSGKRMEVSTRSDGLTVINDSYNASPEAVRAALRTLAAMGTSGPAARRTWAVLGPMSELGEFGDAVHEEIGALAVELGVDRLVIVGERAHAMLRGARRGSSGADGPRGEESVLVPDIDAATTMLRDRLDGGGPGTDDVVLVKGANAFGLWRVAEALLAAGQDAESQDPEPQDPGSQEAGERSVGGAA